MDNYLLMGHILRCKFIPKDEVHPQLWVGSNRKWRKVPRDRIERVRHNKVSELNLHSCTWGIGVEFALQERTDEEKKKVEGRLLKRQVQKKRKLEAAGIDYDLSKVGYVSLSDEK